MSEEAGRLLASLATLALIGLAVISVEAPVTGQVFAATAGVKIHDYSFNPSTIKVVIGVNNTVVWTNRDPVSHTVTASDGSFGSPHILPGASYKHTFNVPGNYSYHCSIHAFMMGMVEVLPSGSPTNSSTATQESNQTSGSHSVTMTTSAQTTSHPTTELTSATKSSKSSTSSSTRQVSTTPIGTSQTASSNSAQTYTGVAAGNQSDGSFLDEAAAVTAVVLAIVVLLIIRVRR